MTDEREFLKPVPPEECALCEGPPVLDGDALTSAAAFGFALAVHGQFPATCVRHGSILARMLVAMHDLHPEVCMGHGSSRASRQSALAAIAAVTGLTPDEVFATVRQHRKDGLGYRESIEYFRKLAQARGSDIELVDDLSATTGLSAFTTGEGPSS